MFEKLRRKLFPKKPEVVNIETGILPKEKKIFCEEVDKFKNYGFSVKEENTLGVLIKYLRDNNIKFVIVVNKDDIIEKIALETKITTEQVDYLKTLFEVVKRGLEYHTIVL